MDENKELDRNKDGEEIAKSIEFCPICGSSMYLDMRYGLMCWICPECDFDIPE